MDKEKLARQDDTFVQEKGEEDKYTQFVGKILAQHPGTRRAVDLAELKYRFVREIISYRRNRCLSRAEFAKRVGTTERMIEKIEKGEMVASEHIAMKILTVIGREEK